jgi:hypothetical protein
MSRRRPLTPGKALAQGLQYLTLIVASVLVLLPLWSLVIRALGWYPGTRDNPKRFLANDDRLNSMLSDIVADEDRCAASGLFEDDRISRFSGIEEDEEPWHLLVSDYKA